jgi:hypothetical protein
MRTIRLEKGDIVEFNGKSYIMLMHDNHKIILSRQVADMSPEEIEEYRERLKDES